MLELITRRRPAAILFVLMTAAALAGCGARGSQELSADQADPVLQRNDRSPKAVSAPLTLTADVRRALDPSEEFLLGIDSAGLDDFQRLVNKRVGLITNSTALDREGISSVQRLLDSPRVTVGRLFHVSDDFSSPTKTFESALAARPGLELVRLTPASFEVTPAMLEGIDTVVVDLALRGYRTEIDVAALGSALEQVSLQEKRMIVFDRPPLLAGEEPIGPIASDQSYGGAATYFPLPVVPALTTGELLRAMNDKYQVHANLHVVPMNNWTRAMANDWMTLLPDDRVTPAGRASLDELRESLFLNANAIRLHAARALTLDATWKTAEFGAGDDKTGELMLVPSLVDSFTLLERLEPMGPVGVDMRVTSATLANSAEAVVRITPNGTQDMQPVAFSLMLQYAAVARPASYPWPKDGGPYGDGEVYALFERGRDAEQVWRRVRVSPEIEAYKAWRRDILLYEP